MVLSTSFPQTSQPGAGRRANSSTRGTSPIRASMRRRASSGFLLCSSMRERMTWWIFFAWRRGLVGKAPRLHDLPRLAEHGHGDPEEQGAVTGSQLGDGQGLDVLNGHGGIVALCQPAAAPYPVVPGRVGINDIILFPYKPNISFTIRSAPFTSPVRISILKINCPMYCHAIVTAGKLLSTAGLLLERNAE